MRRWLRHFAAPLNKLPVFVRQGAIIPMYPSMDYDGQKRADTLTVDIYPHGHSSFDLYEDDGSTQAYKGGAFARTMITADQGKDGSTAISIRAARGNYQGKYTRRVYLIQVHSSVPPQQVTIDGKRIKGYLAADFSKGSGAGWYYDADDRNGTLHIRTPWLSTDKNQDLQIR